MNATANTGETGELALSLPVSSDGEHWTTVSFSGESAGYVDAQAAAYIAAYRDLLEIGIDQATPFHLFPQTFRALQRQAVAAPALLQPAMEF